MRDVSKDLLLVIDVQNVYLPGEAWACPGSVAAITNILKLLSSPNAPDALITQYLPPVDPKGRWKNYNETYREINENAYYNELEARINSLARSGRYPLVQKDTYSALKHPQVQKALEGKTTIVLTGVVAETPAKEAAALQIAGDFAPVHTLVMTSEEYLNHFSAS